MNKGVIVNFFFTLYDQNTIFKDKILHGETIAQHKTIYHVLFPIYSNKLQNFNSLNDLM